MDSLIKQKEEVIVDYQQRLTEKNQLIESLLSKLQKNNSPEAHMDSLSSSQQSHSRHEFPNGRSPDIRGSSSSLLVSEMQNKIESLTARLSEAYENLEHERKEHGKTLKTFEDMSIKGEMPNRVLESQNKEQSLEIQRLEQQNLNLKEELGEVQRVLRVKSASLQEALEEIEVLSRRIQIQQEMDGPFEGNRGKHREDELNARISSLKMNENRLLEENARLEQMYNDLVVMFQQERDEAWGQDKESSSSSSLANSRGNPFGRSHGESKRQSLKKQNENLLKIKDQIEEELYICLKREKETKEELQEAKIALSSEKQHCADLRAMLENEKEHLQLRENDIGRLKQRLDESEREREAVERAWERAKFELEEREESIAFLEKFKRKAESLEKIKEKLEEELTKLSSLFSEERSDYQGQLDGLSSCLEELKKRGRAQEAEVEEYARLLEEKRIALREKEEGIYKMEDELKRAQIAKEASEAQNENLARELGIKRKELVEKEGIIEQERNERNLLEGEFEELKRQMEDEMEILEKEKDKIKEHYEAEIEEINRMMKERIDAVDAEAEKVKQMYFEERDKHRRTVDQRRDDEEKYEEMIGRLREELNALTVEKMRKSINPSKKLLGRKDSEQEKNKQSTRINRGMEKNRGKWGERSRNNSGERDKSEKPEGILKNRKQGESEIGRRQAEVELLSDSRYSSCSSPFISTDRGVEKEPVFNEDFSSGKTKMIHRLREELAEAENELETAKETIQNLRMQRVKHGDFGSSLDFGNESRAQRDQEINGEMSRALYEELCALRKLMDELKKEKSRIENEREKENDENSHCASIVGFIRSLEQENMSQKATFQKELQQYQKTLQCIEADYEALKKEHQGAQESVYLVENQRDEIGRLREELHRRVREADEFYGRAEALEEELRISLEEKKELENEKSLLESEFGTRMSLVRNQIMEQNKIAEERAECKEAQINSMAEKLKDLSEISRKLSGSEAEKRSAFKNLDSFFQDLKESASKDGTIKVLKEKLKKLEREVKESQILKGNLTKENSSLKNELVVATFGKKPEAKPQTKALQASQLPKNARNSQISRVYSDKGQNPKKQMVSLPITDETSDERTSRIEDLCKIDMEAQIITLKSEIKLLQEQLQSAQSQNKKLSETIIAKTTAVDKLEEEKHKLHFELCATQKKHKEEISVAMQQFEKMREKLRSEEEFSNLKSQISLLENEKKTLKEDLARKSAMITTLKGNKTSKEGKEAEKNEQLESLKEENTSLMQKLKESGRREASLKEFREKYERIKESERQLQEEKAITSEKMKALKGEIARKDTMVKDLKEKIEYMVSSTEKVKEFQDEITKQKEKIKSLKAENEKKDSNCLLLKNKIDVLMLELDQERLKSQKKLQNSTGINEKNQRKLEKSELHLQKMDLLKQGYVQLLRRIFKEIPELVSGFSGKSRVNSTKYGPNPIDKYADSMNILNMTPEELQEFVHPQTTSIDPSECFLINIGIAILHL